MRKKIMIIDIDGVVCEHVANEEPEKMATVAPYPEAIERINAWARAGHQICFFTARTENHRAVTEDWLRRHGIHHNCVIYNKPRAIHGEEYHYIDDRPVRATTFRGKFSEFVKKNKEILVFEDD